MDAVAGVGVLEFGPGDERYCLDIAHIDEVVDATELTRIPNAPPHVGGVMDLRGVVKREDGFVVWLDPVAGANADATNSPEGLEVEP